MATNTPDNVKSAVRVWWGFRKSGMDFAPFVQSLGSLFMPVTVQQMAPLGLTAYLPGVLPSVKPPHAPDEVAIVFYESIDVYNQSKNTIAGREYQLLHRALFSFDGARTSKSNFPIALGAELDITQPGYLLQGAATDWQQGTCKFLCGTPKQGYIGAWAWRIAIHQMLDTIQKCPRPGMDSALYWATDGYLTYWEHWAPGSEPDNGNLEMLAELVDVNMTSESAQVVTVPMDINEPYAGFTASERSTLNLRFPRRQAK